MARSKWPSTFSARSTTFRGHAGHLRHVDAEAAVAATRGTNFRRKRTLPSTSRTATLALWMRGKERCHFVQFVVVRGEERFGPTRMFVQEFGDGPSDGDAVVGAGTPADLIQQHQAARR
jgi:hypothetical protein